MYMYMVSLAGIKKKDYPPPQKKKKEKKKKCVTTPILKPTYDQKMETAHGPHCPPPPPNVVCLTVDMYTMAQEI